MAHVLAPYVTPFALNDWLFDTALKAIPEREADRRLDGGVNTARGIAVHALAARHSLCRLLDGKVDPLPWSDVGEGFETGFKQGGDQPRLAIVLEAWQRLAKRLPGCLLGASDEVLARPSPLPVQGVSQPTLADFAAVNIVHESYHLGQLGLIAKAVSGKGIMVPAADGAAV
jgi:hypothetical protein